MAKEQKSRSNGKKRCGQYNQKKVDALCMGLAMGFDINMQMSDACECEAREVIPRVFLHMIQTLGHEKERLQQGDQRTIMHEILKEHFQEVSNMADAIYNSATNERLN